MNCVSHVKPSYLFGCENRLLHAKYVHVWELPTLFFHFLCITGTFSLKNLNCNCMFVWFHFVSPDKSDNCSCRAKANFPNGIRYKHHFRCIPIRLPWHTKWLYTWVLRGITGKILLLQIAHCKIIFSGSIHVRLL